MDYTRATRTIVAALVSHIAGTPDPDGITAAMTADIVAATGHTPDQLGAVITTDGTTATVTLPGREPVTLHPADAVAGILEWHTETAHA